MTITDELTGDYLAVGKIVNTHGVNGELKVIPLTSDISRFDYLLFVLVLKNGRLSEYKVDGARQHKDFILLKLKGIDTMDDAAGMKGLELLVKRENARRLDVDEYFICDILGLEVFEENKRLGVLSDVLETGSNDVYVIKPDAGKEILIPALKAVVLDVDLENKKMTVRLPEGLLDEV